MDATLLRKLSRKSTLKFGMYSDNTVQELLTFKRFNYLRWVYFNQDKITFMDDILDELSITEHYRIKKPGKCPEKYRELYEEKKAKISGKLKMITKKIKNKNNRIKLAKFEGSEAKVYTKGRMQAKNHGISLI